MREQTMLAEDFIAEMDKGLIVTETLGKDVNLLNGDYAKSITGGYVKNGKIQFSVEEATKI